MKKIYYLIAIAGLLAVSCEKVVPIVPDESEDPNAGTYLFTLNANMSEETKTAYEGDVTFSWSDGDQISVLFHNTAAGHEGENEFFTLTTSTGGSNSASFSGYVTNGWEIGASDGEHVKWALYPASDGHKYTVGATNPVDFNIPAETDFTTTHYSANLPMWANGDGSNDFTFKHLTGCYKFEFTNLDVSKVKLVVENIGNGYYLSGTAAIIPTGTDYYWASYEGTGSKVVSYISAVDPVAKNAIFYLPYRLWEGLTPKITLLNQDDGANKGFILLQATGKSALRSTSLTRITIIPPVSVPGTGSPFVSKFGINWSSVTTSGTGGASPAVDGIQTIKATSDNSYAYLFMSVVSDNLLTGYDYTNLFRLYVGSENSSTTYTDVWPTAPNTYDKRYNGWLMYKDNPKFGDAGETDIYVDSQALVGADGLYYYEIKLNRAKDNWLIDGSNTVKAHLGVTVDYNYYAWTRIDYSYMFAPSNGSMLEFDVAPYVAP